MSEYIIACDEETALWIANDVDSMGQIVRCRGCEFFNEYHGKCHRQSGVLIDDYSTRRFEDLGDVLVLADAEPDGFCKWGERRESCTS